MYINNTLMLHSICMFMLHVSLFSTGAIGLTLGDTHDSVTSAESNINDESHYKILRLSKELIINQILVVVRFSSIAIMMPYNVSNNTYSTAHAHQCC